MKGKKGKLNYNDSARVSDSTGSIPGDKAMDINAGEAGTPGYKKGGKVHKVKGKSGKKRLDKPKRGKFIQKMHMKKGAMTEAAESEGVSNSEYEQEHKGDKGKAGKRARLAITLKSFHKK